MNSRVGSTQNLTISACSCRRTSWWPGSSARFTRSKLSTSLAPRDAGVVIQLKPAAVVEIGAEASPVVLAPGDVAPTVGAHGGAHHVGVAVSRPVHRRVLAKRPLRLQLVQLLRAERDTVVEPRGLRRHKRHQRHAIDAGRRGESGQRCDGWEDVDLLDERGCANRAVV